MSLNSFTVDENLALTSFVLHWPSSVQLANEQFFDFCQMNKNLHIERAESGDYEIMAPTGGETSWRNSSLTAQLYVWAEKDDKGVVFDSSGGFILPNGATRSPDAAWVKKSRLAILTPEQRKKFLPLCPDFVIELRSPSDSLKTLHEKMAEYIENGASLGWLIDPNKQQVFIFQTNKAVLILDKPELLSANDLLLGFELNMQKIWEVDF